MLVDFGSFHSRVHRHFSPSPLRLNIFRLFVILSLTQLYRYTPKILVARLFMFLLIFNEQRVPKITFVLVLTYYVKLHLFVILTAIGWFIVNIQSDLFWHRCLGRQAFGTTRMYTLSPSKSIKGSNYGEFLKDKKIIVMYTTVQVRSKFGKFAYTAICMRNVHTLIW